MAVQAWERVIPRHILPREDFYELAAKNFSRLEGTWKGQVDFVLRYHRLFAVGANQINDDGQLIECPLTKCGIFNKKTAIMGYYFDYCMDQLVHGHPAKGQHAGDAIYIVEVTD